MWTIGGDSVEMLKYVCGVPGTDPGMSHAALKVTLSVVVGLGVWAYHSVRGWYQGQTLQTPTSDCCNAENNSYVGAIHAFDPTLLPAIKRCLVK